MQRFGFLLNGLAALFLTLAAGATVVAAPAFPDPIPDDNGDYAFAREVVPILLGRKPRGALEVKLLGDIAQLLGRDVMLRTLMESAEFQVHWADQLMDLLSLQRGGFRSQSSTCFQNPLRSVHGGSLALSIQNGTATQPVSGNPFNMRDITLSAIALDDMDVVLRAYLFPLATQRGRNAVGEENYRQVLGRHFSHSYLNRNVGCLVCHNETDAVTDAPGDGPNMWDRHFPVELGIDKSVFGDQYGGLTVDRSERSLLNLFRTDQLVQKPSGSDISANAFTPWGIDLNCVTNTRANPDRVGFARPDGSSNAEAEFADISGNDRFVGDLDESLRDGAARIRNEGLALVQDPDYSLPVPEHADAALAFEVAMSFVDLVWERVMGRGLTIENYFPRNEHQRDALWHLTEEAFLPDWSLKDLLTTILLSAFTDRRSPKYSVLDEPYSLPLIFDPWVERDPRDPDPPPVRPDNTHNGQGEIVRKHEPRTLMRQAASALGLNPPALFGGGSYPATIQRDIGQYWSENQPGHRGFDLQTILAWEEVHGLCTNSNNDWIDRLLVAVDQYDADNALEPLNLREVVQTLKDWLIQDAEIRSQAAIGATVSEVEALATLFGTDAIPQIPITTLVSNYLVFASPQAFEAGLRAACSAFVTSPQFMLKGISVRDPLMIPALRVCNDPNECSYQQMCETFAELLEDNGQYIECLADGVVPGDAPPPGGGFDACAAFPDICGGRIPVACLSTRLPDVIGPMPFELDCPVDIPRCDPRCGGFSFGGGLPERFGSFGGLPGGGELGLPCCGGRPDFGRFGRDDILVWLEGAIITEVQDVYVLPLDGDRIMPAEKGHKLAFGEVLIAPPGASLRIADGTREYQYGGQHGVPTRAELTSRKIDAALTSAVDKGDMTRARRLLTEGANPNAYHGDGRSALTLAVEQQQPLMVAQLIAAGADVNRPDARGNLPLALANSQERCDISSLLASSGAVAARERSIRKTELPQLIMITGPSAATAPHPAGGRYATVLQRNDSKRSPMPIKHRLELMRKAGHLDGRLSKEAALEHERNRTNLIDPDIEREERYLK